MNEALRLAVVAGLTAGVVGCGGGSDAGGGEAGTGERPSSDAPAATDSSAGADTAGADSTAGSESTTGDRRPLRKRLLRLVNAGGEEVVAHAAAGLGWVVLDTVPAGDSSEVYVESRAPRVALRAVGSAGPEPVATDSVDLTGTGPARWRIPPADSSSEDDPAADGGPREGPSRRSDDAQPPSSPVKNLQVSTSRS